MRKKPKRSSSTAARGSESANGDTGSSCYRSTNEGDILLRVRVQPRASRDAIRVGSDQQLGISLTAPAVEGSANRALVAFISKWLGVAKSRVSIEYGEKSRAKTIRIRGIDDNEFASFIRNLDRELMQ